MDYQNKDKSLVVLSCPDCANEFTITYGRYRRFDKSHEFRCASCERIRKAKLGRERFEKMNEHEKFQWTHQGALWWKSRTSEEKDILRRKYSDAKKTWWSSLSEDERKKMTEAIVHGIANMSKDDKSTWRSRISSAQKRAWESLTIEQRMNKMKPVFDGCKKFWKNASDSEKEEIFKKISNAVRVAQARMSLPNKISMSRKRVASWKKYWDALSDEEKYQRMLCLWNSQVNIGPTELDFISDLEYLGLVNGIHFIQSYDTAGSSSNAAFIHPDFYTIFGHKNPVTGGENYPFHRWDFVLNLPDENKILVDIDGSAHNPQCMRFKRAGNSYTERDMIDYNDAKRPYQIPDGFTAYVIKCYDNALNKDSIVYQISLDKNNCVRFKYDEFLLMIMEKYFDIPQLPELEYLNNIGPKSSTTISKESTT